MRIKSHVTSLNTEEAIRRPHAQKSFCCRP